MSVCKFIVRKDEETVVCKMDIGPDNGDFSFMGYSFGELSQNI